MIEESILSSRLLAHCFVDDKISIANELIAELYSIVVSKEFEKHSIANLIFKDVIYFSGSDIPKIPIEEFFSQNQSKVWTDSFPDGLIYNELTGGGPRFRLNRTDSEVAFNRGMANWGFPLVNRGIRQMTENIVKESERKAFQVLAGALGNSGKIKNIGGAKIQNYLSETLDNLYGDKKLTDLFVSPEVFEVLKCKDEKYNGLTVHALTRLGAGQEYNKLFKQNYQGSDWSAGLELVFAIDNKQTFSRVMEKDKNGNVVFIQPDDQHTRRTNKWGFFGYVNESWAVCDGIVGALVNVK